MFTFVGYNMLILFLSTLLIHIARIKWKSVQVTVQESVVSISHILNTCCDSCHTAEQTRSPFPESSNKATKKFELVHMNTWGPYSTSSLSGCHYFLTLVDDYSRSIWVYLVQANLQPSRLLVLCSSPNLR